MKKFLVFAGVALVIVIGLGWGVSQYQTQQTKSFSPEDHVNFSSNGVNITVFYNRPYKKDREIFGSLVPYDKVWRTGANEATTFESNKELTIEGHVLRRGKYSLWTIPGKEKWTFIFNSQYGQWGVNSAGEPNRDPTRDVLTVDARPVTHDTVFEQLTIAFEKTGGEAEMVLMWDNTIVALPFSY